MKAIRVHEYGGPEVLQLEEIEDPVITTSDGVLIGMHASGVNPAEVSRRAGKGMPIQFPAILGIEGAGEVIEIGSDVHSVSVGDRVVVRQPAPERSGIAIADRGRCYEVSRRAPLLQAS